MRKKIISIIVLLLMLLPIIVFADDEEHKVRIGDEYVLDGKCINNICLDASNETVTMDSSTDLPKFSSFEKLKINIKGNVVWDLSEYTGDNDYTFASMENVEININDNSTLTIKNNQNLIGFLLVDIVLIKGGTNSKIVFENSTLGFGISSAPATIKNVTIESKTPMEELIYLFGSEEDTLTLENTIINVDKSENLFEYEYLIGVQESSLIIKNSTITSKFESKSYEIEGNFNLMISVGKDMDIFNSKLDLKNYAYSLDIANSVRIKESEINIENTVGGIYSTNILFENGILHISSIEDGLILPENESLESFAGGLISENSIDIRNGYLSFSGKVIPLVAEYTGTLSSDYTNYIKIGSSLKANKEYIIGSFGVTSYGVVYLAKKGTEKAIIIGDEPITEINKYVIQDVIFQGKTKVHFDAGDGTGKMNDVEVDYLTDKLPENKLTAPEGKRFKGWSTSKDGEIITKLTNTDEVTLYPVWEDIPKEEKKEKENPNTGAIISLAIVGSMLSIGGCLYYRTNKSSKFN